MKLTEDDRNHLNELGGLIERWRQARRKRHAFSGEEAERFGMLYRHASTLLSMASTVETDPDVRAYLHQLVGQAHACLYAFKPFSASGLSRFFLDVFPATFRKRFPFILVSAVLFTGISALVLGVVWADPDLAYELFDADVVAKTIQQLRETPGEFKGNFTFGFEESPWVSEWIIVNNLKVGLLLFTAGALAGVLTALGLIYNGIMLGVFFGLALRYGHGWDTFFLLMTHGTIELTMIILCGGAGFLLGSAVLAPGDLTRREAFRKRGLESVILMLGTVPFITLAGLIEGFITPHANLQVRALVVFISALGLVFYLGWCGKKRGHRSRIRAPFFKPKR